MKVVDILNSAGEPVAFQVSNLLLSRRAACRVASRIPGVTNLVRRRLFENKTYFCSFELEGQMFTIMEPWDDSNAYWIQHDAPGYSSSIALVRAAFENHRVGIGLW